MYIKLKEKRSNCEDQQTNMYIPAIKHSSSEFTNDIKVAKSHVLWPCLFHELLSPLLFQDH